MKDNNIIKENIILMDSNKGIYKGAFIHKKDYGFFMKENQWTICELEIMNDYKGDKQNGSKRS